MVPRRPPARHRPWPPRRRGRLVVRLGRHRRELLEQRLGPLLERLRRHRLLELDDGALELERGQLGRLLRLGLGLDLRHLGRGAPALGGLGLDRRRARAPPP